MYSFVLALCLVPASPKPANEAEQLLREMDAKILAAKSMRIEFAIDDSTVGKEQQLTKGFLVIGKGNRFRYELSGTIAANVASDGKHMVTVIGTPPEKKSQLTPQWFNEILQRSLGCGGTFVSFGKILEYAEKSVGEEPGADKLPRVSNAGLLPEEKLNGVNVRVVEYDLGWPTMLDKVDFAKVRVWIDPNSKLPLRRTMTFQLGKEEKVYTAAHTKFELDPALDDKFF